MPYYIIHAGTALQKMSADGNVDTILLPNGVTVSDQRPARFALLNRTLLVANAPSRTLLFDGSIRTQLAGLAFPATKPNVAAGAGALTGAYICAYSYVIKDASGNVVVESELSPISSSITLTAQGLTISNILPSTTWGVTTRRIYRSASGGDTLYWAHDIDDNVTTSYTSAELDAGLGTTSVADLGLGTAPGSVDGERLKIVTVFKDRVWGVTNLEPDNLRFSGLRAPYAWDPDNMIRVPQVGSDEVGVNGFLARRDELGVLRLNRIYKVVGSSPDQFELIEVVEGIGTLSPDTCIVIRDVGYFLGHDGVYTWGPEGVQTITDANVRPWFTTDTYFNRSQFSKAFGRYNWRTHSYELHLPSAGQTTIDRWVQYDIDRQRWFGPHKTDAFVPTCGGQIVDANGLDIPAVGAADGYLYTQNNASKADSGSGIAYDVQTQPITGEAPDREKLFREMSVLCHEQAAGTLTITPTLNATAVAAISAPLTSPRSRLRRIGRCRLLTLRFQNSEVDQECEVYGFEIPFHILGRR